MSFDVIYLTKQYTHLHSYTEKTTDSGYYLASWLEWTTLRALTLRDLTVQLASTKVYENCVFLWLSTVTMYASGNQ